MLHWHIIIESDFAKIRNENFAVDHSTVHLMPLCLLHTQHLSDDVYLQIKHFQNKLNIFKTNSVS